MNIDIEDNTEEELEVSKIMFEEDKKRAAYCKFKKKQLMEFERQLENKLPNEFRKSISNYNHRNGADNAWHLDDNDYNIF